MSNDRQGTLREWLARLWGSFRPSRADADLEQELQTHLELAMEDERRRREQPDSRRVAVVRAGPLAQSMEALREQRGLPWLDDVRRDLRYGLRSLRRNPSFALVSLLTLAVGIGATAAVFTVVNSVLLQPLPYPDADRLVAVWHKAPGAPGLSNVSGDLRPSASMFFTYAEENRTFEAIGLWAPGSMTVTGLAEPEQVPVVFVSDGTLQALDVQPFLGRWLSDEDQRSGNTEAVMLSFGYWQRRFGADRTTIGRGVTVDGRVRTVVGVMPEGFRIADTSADLFVPYRFDRKRLILAGFGHQGIARLKPGVTLDQANADVARMLPIWMRSWPTLPGADPAVYERWKIAPALRGLKDDVVEGVDRTLWVLFGTVGIVLLMVCTNVATLVLVRAEGRRQELAVRAALGAGWSRIVRGLLIEGLLLGFVGGALGLGLAHLGLQTLAGVGTVSLPRLHEITIGSRTLAVTSAASLFAGVLFGLIPAFRYVRPALVPTLGSARTSSQSGERHRLHDVLVVAQVSLAFVLLVGAGLMIRTSQALRAVEPGFTRADQLQTVRISMPASVVIDPVRVVRAQHEMLEKLAAIPGVTSAGFSNALPMDGLAADWDVISAEGSTVPADGTPPLRLLKYVSPGFFQTMGTRIVAGRDYTWTDLYDRRPAAIVSENLATDLWGSPSAALGKRIGVDLPGTRWREVIGVVQDVRDNGIHAPAPTIVYWPALMETLYSAGEVRAARHVTIAIRSERAGTEGLLHQIRQAIWSVNGSVSPAEVRTMRRIADQSMMRTSVMVLLLAVTGAVALVLGLVGLYGVVSYSVSRRTREIGTRIALGAQAGEVKRMVVGRGLALTALGVAIGLAAAAAVMRLMSSVLFGISPLDPVTFASVPLLLIGAAALASYLPARRAAAIDPVMALKVE